MALVLLFTAFLVLLLNSAWVSEDAYIILRTVANTVQGYGLRWNTAERVQTYTCPLWTLLLVGVCGVTREYYFTTVVLSAALAITAVVLLMKFLGINRWATVSCLGLMVSSKAFMDYTTSGLENALNYLLLVGFYIAYFREERISLRGWLVLGLLAALVACNRMDVALLCVFPLLHYLGRLRVQEHVPIARLLLIGAAAAAPFIAWLLFALIYYGFPFPNTAYAKLHTGIPARKLFYRGLLYGVDSLSRDPVTLTTVGIAAATSLLRRNAKQVSVTLSLALYLAYVAKIGGDFMSGRFFSLPFLTACVLLVQWPLRPWLRAVVMPAAVGLSLLGDHPPITYGPRFENKARPRYIADERGYYYQWTGFWPVIANGGEPRGPWVDAGRKAQRERLPVIVAESVGLLGYYAGPRVHIVDRLALCDPLLARMQVPDKDHWRVGHYARRMPEGYLETLESGTNVIENPKLRELYEVLKTITRGPIWSGNRFREIVRINLGRYGHLMREA